MRSLSRAVRVLMWGLFAGWIIAIVRRMLMPAPSRRTGAQWKPAPAPAPPKPIPLHRDPWCGTFVSPEISVQWEERPGHMKHFCSRECLNRYATSQRRAASA